MFARSQRRFGRIVRADLHAALAEILHDATDRFLAGVAIDFDLAGKVDAAARTAGVAPPVREQPLGAREAVAARLAGGDALLARPDVSQLLVEGEPMAQLHRAGAGYAELGDRWRHGQYHGELEVEGETWDITDEEFLKTIQGQNQTVCKVTAGDASGYGIFELIVFGLYEPYGFKTPMDVAK